MNQDERPHYLLFSEATPGRSTDDGLAEWRFVLESTDGERILEAHDREERLSGERLELMAVVRGLEALEQPSRVTLLTPSAYVTRCLRQGLDEWRENDWQWERFGEMVPVKNRDLWKRVDRALAIHRVDCRIFRIDPAHAIRRPHDESEENPTEEILAETKPISGETRKSPSVARAALSPFAFVGRCLIRMTAPKQDRVA